ETRWPNDIPNMTNTASPRFARRGWPPRPPLTGVHEEGRCSPIPPSQRLDGGIGEHLQLEVPERGAEGPRTSQVQRGIGWARTEARRTSFGERSDGKRRKRARGDGEREGGRGTSSLEAYEERQGAARTRFSGAIPDRRATPAADLFGKESRDSAERERPGKGIVGSSVSTAAERALQRTKRCRVPTPADVPGRGQQARRRARRDGARVPRRGAISGPRGAT